MGRKLLLTGATGGLGRNAFQGALHHFDDIVACGRNASVLDALALEGAQTRRMDMTQLSERDWRALLGDCDTVWHTAARSSLWGDFRHFYEANVTATRTLARAAGQAGVGRFVHISSPSIYMDFRHQHQVKESMRPRRWANAYAHTKALAELEILRAARDFPDTTFVMLRPRAIFGAHDAVLLPRILRVAKERGSVPLPRQGAALLDFTYAPNVVEAMRQASDAPVRSGSVFNISNQEPMTIGAVLTGLFEAMDEPLRIRSAPYALLAAAARAAEWRAPIEKEPALTRYGVAALHYDFTMDHHAAQNELGYRPIVDMQSAIAQTAAWWKNRLSSGSHDFSGSLNHG